jgi:hypothetical protein
MESSHASAQDRIAADSGQGEFDQPEKAGEYDKPPSLTSSDQDDADLKKLGYVSVLARGWGAFDNFACSFSALYCIGGIRVLFYIAFNNGGPAAMFVLHSFEMYTSSKLTCVFTGGARGSPAASSQSSPLPPSPKPAQLTPPPGPSTTGHSALGAAAKSDASSHSSSQPGL